MIGWLVLIAKHLLHTLNGLVSSSESGILLMQQSLHMQIPHFLQFFLVLFIMTNGS
jgi:hypothetical protein